MKAAARRPPWPNESKMLASSTCDDGRREGRIPALNAVRYTPSRLTHGQLFSGALGRAVAACAVEAARRVTTRERSVPGTSQTGLTCIICPCLSRFVTGAFAALRRG